MGQESRNARLAEETRAKFQELCVGPFKDVVGPDIPHIAVSSKPQRDFQGLCLRFPTRYTASKEYRDTRKILNELVHLTAHCVKKSLAVDIAEDVALVSAIAQRVNPAVKIDAVIA